MLERKIYRRLLEWKSREHKCLVLRGQRQVGKTFIVDVFAKSEYEHYININFSDSPEFKRMFEGDVSAREIVRKLSLYFGADSIVDGSTLIFLDEIQECSAAYSALKQFTMYGKLDVIASGSLLGTMSLDDDGDRLAPVGYVETITMYPLDFEEFLWARSFPKESITVVRKNIRKHMPIEQVLFDRLSQLFREFMIVGGMPEAVDAFTKDGDFRPANGIIGDIISTCIYDINRYNHGVNRIKTLDCFESIPHQLSESNRKFMYSRISGEGTRAASDRYGENLLWIREAGYGNFCYSVTQPVCPLAEQVDRKSFKVYLSDTGMLLHMYGDKAKMAVYEGDYSYNMGSVAENVVAECLMKSGYPPMYYRKDKGEGRMELDFVEEFWDGIAVIEVKSGKNKIAPSLKKVSELYDVARRIMFSSENVGVDMDGIEHYPLFASAFIDEIDTVPEGPKFS